MPRICVGHVVYIKVLEHGTADNLTGTDRDRIITARRDHFCFAVSLGRVKASTALASSFPEAIILAGLEPFDQIDADFKLVKRPHKMLKQPRLATKSAFG
jgi:hypothetical protein